MNIVFNENILEELNIQPDNDEEIKTESTQPKNIIQQKNYNISEIDTIDKFYAFI